MLILSLSVCLFVRRAKNTCRLVFIFFTCVLHTIMKSQSHNPVLRHTGSAALSVIQVLHYVPVGVNGLGMTHY